MTIQWGLLLHNGYETEKEMITKMHYEENLTIEEMSLKLGIDHSTLKRKIKELDITMKKPGGIPFSKHGKRGRKRKEEEYFYL